MKSKLVIASLIIAAFSLAFNGEGMNNDKNPYEKYSEVKVFLNSPDDLLTLAKSGIDIEHYTGSIEKGITLTLNQVELTGVKSLGFRCEVTIPDMDVYYANRPPASQIDLQNAHNIMHSDNVNSFGYGSMGGFYTYDEVVQKLDSMRLQFPNLISSKLNRGVTANGKVIWAVKISDNPDIDESATETVIYFDALHHAREPQGMACLMYYMYWLLENYGTNAEATYLVNNREIYFIPVVNADGYLYNQSTNPSGGGSWRKNRRNNTGSYGVDLNRNYSYMWGYDNIGSSNVPSSDTYRGPSAASEPEVQAVQNLCNLYHPAIAFSMHSEASTTLNPYGYNDSAASYNLYSEFASDFTAKTQYLYGTVYQMLNYYSNGTTRDFLHSIGTLCWVIEVGGGSFWPVISQIIPVASTNLPSLKYLTWTGGNFANFQNYRITGKEYAEKNDTLQIEVGIKNKGLKKTAKNISVNLTTTYPNAVPLTATVSYDSILSRQVKYNTSSPFKFRLTNAAVYMDEITFLVTISQEGVVSCVDTIRTIVGRSNVLFYDNAETGTAKWTKSGTQTQWDTTFCDSYDGIKSFADSRYGNSKNNTNNFFTMKDTINLIGAANPRIEFAAKWATEITYDYARIQVSTNFGSTWTNLSGRYTSLAGGQPSYTGIQSWIKDRVSLNAFIGQKVFIRFNYYTDAGTAGDGFYFDDFRVVNYTNTVTGISQSGSEIPSSYSLSQNFPNPFNPSTTVGFDIPKAGFVSIKIFDITGREVTKLVNNNLSAGSYKTNWDASGFPSGVYYYRMDAAVYTSVKSMILIK